MNQSEKLIDILYGKHQLYEDTKKELTKANEIIKQKDDVIKTLTLSAIKDENIYHKRRLERMKTHYESRIGMYRRMINSLTKNHFCCICMEDVDEKKNDYVSLSCKHRYHLK